MSDASDFFDDPVGFLQTHVLRCQFIDRSSGVQESRPKVVTIKELPGASVVGSRTGKVFALSADTAGCSLAEKRPIYWLGYKDNDATRLMLTNAAPLMFTANMDGCTLGIGSQAGDGACLVSHANMRSSGGGEAQRQAQEDQLRGVFTDQGFRMLQPSGYRLENEGPNATAYKATNFGINDGGTWRFYSHVWMNLQTDGESKIYGRHIHLGCKPARPVPPVPRP